MPFSLNRNTIIQVREAKDSAQMLQQRFGDRKAQVCASIGFLSEVLLWLGYCVSAWLVVMICTPQPTNAAAPPFY